jgi:hypothetical protein
MGKVVNLKSKASKVAQTGSLGISIRSKRYSMLAKVAAM